MAKGKQRPPMYNRPSKGYQQNVYKQQMKERDIKFPKQIDMEKWNKINKVLGVVWVIAMLLGSFLVNWKLGLVIVVVGLIYIGGFMYYINNYLKSFIKAYKQMGFPKDMYLKQLKRGGTDAKQIARMSTMWDKVKVD